MIGLLRRYQPENPLLAVIYWLLVVVVVVVGLGVLFFYLDSVFELGGGMF